MIYINNLRPSMTAILHLCLQFGLLHFTLEQNKNIAFERPDPTPNGES
jgi:hypothetical protein